MENKKITPSVALSTIGSAAYAGLFAIPAIALGPPLLEAHNKAKAGPISYKAEMNNMTGKYRETTTPINSGTVNAMKNAAQGDPVIFQDMAKHVLHSSPKSYVENYGVDANFISAFYGMG